MKHRVIVFGDLPIATKVVMWICSQPAIELIGVVIGNKKPNNNDPWEDVPLLWQYSEQNAIRQLTLDEIRNMDDGEVDLGLVCRFGKIIKQDIIDKFRIGMINMHGGLLPEFAGLYSCNMSVLYGASVGGGTLHYIDAGIDTGDVLRRCEFNIEKDDTGYSVFQKTQKVLYENMIDIIPLVLNNAIQAIPMQDLLAKGHEHRYFNKESIGKQKKITEQDLVDPVMLLRKVRAFDFPGYEPAYYEVDGKRIYMRTTH